MEATAAARVIAGPAGHWYAYHCDELVARPRESGEAEPPAHPSVSDDGWYSPDDLGEGVKYTLTRDLVEDLRVTFKHEDSARGQAIGPVKVIDLDAYHRDPEVRKGGLGYPFGYEPQGLEDLGWMTLAQAHRVARERGVELTEV